MKESQAGRLFTVNYSYTKVDNTSFRSLVAHATKLPYPNEITKVSIFNTKALVDHGQVPVGEKLVTLLSKAL